MRTHSPPVSLAVAYACIFLAMRTIVQNTRPYRRLYRASPYIPLRISRLVVCNAALIVTRRLGFATSSRQRLLNSSHHGEFPPARVVIIPDNLTHQTPAVPAGIVAPLVLWRPGSFSSNALRVRGEPVRVRLPRVLEQAPPMQQLPLGHYGAITLDNNWQRQPPQFLGLIRTLVSSGPPDGRSRLRGELGESESARRRNPHHPYLLRFSVTCTWQPSEGYTSTTGGSRSSSSSNASRGFDELSPDLGELSPPSFRTENIGSASAVCLFRVVDPSTEPMPHFRDPLFTARSVSISSGSVLSPRFFARNPDDATMCPQVLLYRGLCSFVSSNSRSRYLISLFMLVIIGVPRPPSVSSQLEDDQSNNAPIISYFPRRPR